MKNKILFAFSLLFGLMFINAGLDKFFHYMPMPANMPKKMQDTFSSFMQIGWILPLVGVIEIVGGILFIFTKTRALGAIVIFPVMVGILLTNIITDSEGIAIALILLFINMWVIIENKQKYLPLIS